MAKVAISPVEVATLQRHTAGHISSSASLLTPDDKTVEIVTQAHVGKHLLCVFAHVHATYTI